MVCGIGNLEELSPAVGGLSVCETALLPATPAVVAARAMCESGFGTMSSRVVCRSLGWTCLPLSIVREVSADICTSPLLVWLAGATYST